jgi:integrase/recombinase XerD
MKWEMPSSRNSQLSSFKRYLDDQGFRPVVVETYLFRVGKYLELSRYPNQESFDAFREHLRARGLKRATINNYSIAIKAYHKSLGEVVTYKYLKVKNIIPYHFREDEILAIFNSICNFKHYAMLNVLFYGALRANELASLDVQDVDLETRTIRVREGKGGYYGTVFITRECTEILRDYLAIRRKFPGKALFLTAQGNRWNRFGISRLVKIYKKKAGVITPGSAHVFARHSVASILIKNGASLSTVQHILRHRDVVSTSRYIHLSDGTKQAQYDQYLRI